MCPAVLLAAHPEGAPVQTSSDTTETILVQEVNSSKISSMYEEARGLPPALLATLFLVLGVVVFLAVMLKRVTSRPEMMQCPVHMKSCMYSYGSINFPLDDMYKKENDRFAVVRCQEISTIKTRPTKFISVSDMWKAKQLQNQRQINIISEEPEDTHLKLLYVTAGR